MSYCGPASISLHVITTNLYGLSDFQAEFTELEQDDGDSLMMLVTGDSHGQKYDLSDEGKLFLASRLAFAVWQYYNSSWMACEWTAHTIHFLREHHLGRTGFDSVTELPLKPYIRMHFQGPGTPTREPRPVNKFGMLHPDRKISALGIMLAVIFWGPLSSWTAAKEMNEMCRSTHEIVECISKTRRDLRLSMNSVFPIEENIREIVKACLDLDAIRGLQEDERRKYLLEHIVSPLEYVISALKVSGFRSSSENWRPTGHREDPENASSPACRPSPTTNKRYVARTLLNCDLMFISTFAATVPRTGSTAFDAQLCLQTSETCTVEKRKGNDVASSSRFSTLDICLGVLTSQRIYNAFTGKTLCPTVLPNLVMHQLTRMVQPFCNLSCASLLTPRSLLLELPKQAVNFVAKSRQQEILYVRSENSRLSKSVPAWKTDVSHRQSNGRPLNVAQISSLCLLASRAFTKTSATQSTR
jgi:hypothetical protein